MSVLGAVESLEGVTSGTAGRRSQGEALLGIYPVVCLREFLMRWDACLDPGTGYKLTTTDTPLLSFSKLLGERVELTDLALAREIEALLVLWRDWSKYLFRILSPL